MKQIYKEFAAIVCIVLLSSCASYKAQYKDENSIAQKADGEILHSFYLIGDAGYSPIGSKSEALRSFEKELMRASKNSTALFLGDNIYPKGLPKKGAKGRLY